MKKAEPPCQFLTGIILGIIYFAGIHPAACIVEIYLKGSALAAYVHKFPCSRTIHSDKEAHSQFTQRAENTKKRSPSMSAKVKCNIHRMGAGNLIGNN